MSVVAPYVSSYTNRVPYLTVAEYQNAPTAIDSSDLVDGGSTQQETDILQEVIGRASSWIDTYCMGAQGTLCADVSTEVGRIRSNREGWVVRTKYWPILEVQAFSVGSNPGDLQVVALSSANCWPEERQFIVTNSFGLTSSAGPLQFGTVPGRDRVGFAQWRYVNGWPNTTLTAAAAPGATSVALANTAGIYPGTQLTVYDVPDDEQIVVASSFVEGNLTVPLLTPLQSAHAAGVSVSNLPPAIKQAAILLTSLLIQTRGDGAIVLDEIAEPRNAEAGVGRGGRDSDIGIAAELLNPFRVIWGQS